MNWTTLLKRAAVYGGVTAVMFAFDVPKKIKEKVG
jgi:hypothetical protein